jgi:hypothetical protein
LPEEQKKKELEKKGGMKERDDDELKKKLRETSDEKKREREKRKVVRFAKSDPTKCKVEIIKDETDNKIDFNSSGMPQHHRMETSVIGTTAMSGVLAESRGSTTTTSPTAQLAPVPEPIHMHKVKEENPGLYYALTNMPPLRKVSSVRRPRPSYVHLTEQQRLQLRPMLALWRPTGGEETASIFTRPKPNKNELRLIVDARNANRRNLEWKRLGPRMPNVQQVAEFLTKHKFAAACDFRNFFYSIPIGQRLQRLFYIPQLQSVITRLPMGWSRAPDYAAAVAQTVVGSSTRSSSTAETLICIDNVLVGATTEHEARKEVQRIRRRVEEFRVTFSQDFEAPSRKVKFFGVEWDLESQRRRLPVEQARKAKRMLLEFARSRGGLSRDKWRRVVGVAGWVATVLNVDITRRLAMLVGMRVAEHRRDEVVPGKRARREARRLAERAERSVRLNAPADSKATGVAFPMTFSRTWDWFVSDAAVPGSVSVIHFAPDREGRLVYWREVEEGWSAVAAELEGVRQAARAARVMGLRRAVLVTDSQSVFGMIRRGVSRNERFHEAIREVRDAVEMLRMVWLPSEGNVADEASRAPSRAEARDCARQWTDPVGMIPRGSPKPFGFTFRRLE